jgi:tRNA-dihydrouridine synthase
LEIRSGKVEAYFEEEARAVEEKIQVPLFLVGGIRSYNVAKQLAEEGTVDNVSMCRPFIREPDLINRWKAGDLRSAACISCNNCIEQARKGEGISRMPLEEAATESLFPQISEEIPASPPHPAGTSCRISIGLEQREINFIPVVEIRMVQNGRVCEGSPSFPLGTKDHARVGKAIADLLDNQAAEQEKG